MRRLDRKASKPFALVAAVLLIATIGTGTTFAWLATKSDEAVNTFVPGTVTATIVEEFNGNTKNNVQVKNEGNIDVYIRVALVPTWEMKDGANWVVAPIPASLSDLNMSLNLGGNTWFQGNDGYYYFKNKVVPQGYTDMLISSATVKGSSAGAQAGYNMNLQVLAEAIQATQKAVDDAWGTTIWPSLTH